MLIAVPLVRIFINSGTSFSSGGLDSMPLTLADGASVAVGGALPAVAPLIGALGSFASGSNTISNIMFAQFQFAAAEAIGADPAIVVAALAVGGAAGSMVTVHNIVAAAATVGLMGREGDLLRKTFIALGYYLLAAGAMALLLVTGPGVNTGTGLLGLLVALGAVVLLRARRERRA
jgi:lactate permease